MASDLHHVYAASLSHPITYEQAEARGLLLYGCFPLCVSLDSDTVRYLALVSFPGRIHSEEAFDLLALFGVYSWQWVAYYGGGSGGC